MPCCDGLIYGPCRYRRNDNSGRLGEGDLMLPHVEKPFCLHTDASGFAVGAALSQLNE